MYIKLYLRSCEVLKYVVSRYRPLDDKSSTIKQRMAETLFLVV